MHYLLGIDDTDNLESRGTGHRARQMADWLAENKLAQPQGITRHQLLVDPRIPYTSHNSSACLSVETKNPDDVWEASREFLLRESAQGSDAGLNSCKMGLDQRSRAVLREAGKGRSVDHARGRANSFTVPNKMRGTDRHTWWNHRRIVRRWITSRW